MADDVTPLRTQRLGAVGEHATEVADRAIRVGLLVGDVLPLEVPTVADRIEASVSAGAGDRSRNETGVHVLMEHNGVLISCGLVRRVDDELGALLTCWQVRGGIAVNNSHVRIHFDPRIADEVPPFGEHVDEVVEATERTIHAERGEKLVNFTRVPTIVLPDAVVIPKKLIGGFRAADDGELRTAILTTHGLVASTVTDKLQVDPIKDTLSQTGRRLLSGERSRSLIQSSSIGFRHNLVLGNADVLIPVPILPRPRSVLLEDLEDVGELLLAFHGEAQVVHTDLRRFKRSVLQVVAAEGLGEPNFFRCRNAVGTASDADVTPSKTRLVVQRPFVGQHADGVAHLIRPSVLLDKLKPRRRVERLTIDVGADTARFIDEQLLDVVSHKKEKLRRG